MGKDEVREGGLAEQNSHMLYENKEVSNGVILMGQDLGPSGEDEPKGNGSSVNFENGPSPLKGVCMNDGLQVSQPQGPIIRWERFLPVRSLKVLLVENDDSTRHVVSALLRNCSYEGKVSSVLLCFLNVFLFLYLQYSLQFVWQSLLLQMAFKLGRF